MDRPSIVAWLREHAVAIQLDVDAHPDLARQLRVEATPTLITFVDGTELDRVVGAKRPKELLAWLDGILRGETALEASGTPEDRRARLDLACELSRAGRYDEALVELLWLWEHMLEAGPRMSSPRTRLRARRSPSFAIAPHRRSPD